jgi:hypothetical protein
LVVDLNQSLVTDEFRTWGYGAEIHGGIGSWARAALRLGYYDDQSGRIQDWTYGAGIRVFGASVDVASIPQVETLPRVRKWTFRVPRGCAAPPARRALSTRHDP